MKIHRIQAVNLNSLYGMNDLDLDTALDGASLFLICGPTGSGKSTLMDAVSLALFGKTPRLDKHNPRGGEKGLRDPRMIMSRGEHQCTARVVFSKLVQGGRQTFRATWSCHRARKRADGKFQSVQRSLEAQTETGWKLLVSGDKKKDHDRVFPEVLEGFGVNDFNRSMLLAQGKFDAFLSAPPPERAEILERLTDTSDYQQIGSRAHQIHGRHRKRIDALAAQAAVGSQRTPEEVTQLEQQHAVEVSALETEKQRSTSATTRLSWFETDRNLRAELGEARAALAGLVEQIAAEQANFQRLSEHERCEAAGAFRSLDDHRAAQARLDRVSADLTEISQALPALLAVEAETKQVATRSSADLARVQTQLDGLRPWVSAADDTEKQRVEGVSSLERARSEAAAATLQHTESETSLTQRKTAMNVARGVAQMAQATLAVHRSDRALTAAWGSLRPMLSEQISGATRLAAQTEKARGDAEALTTERQALNEAQQAHQDDAARAMQPLAEAHEAARVSLSERVTHADLDTTRDHWNTQIDVENRQLTHLRAAVAPAAEVHRGAAKVTALTAEIAASTASRDQAAASLVEATAAVAHTQQQHAAAVADHRRTEQLAALVSHRIGLEDGVPCALCGSAEHPYAHDAERIAADQVIAQTLADALVSVEVAQRSHEAAVITAKSAQSQMDAREAELRMQRARAAQLGVEQGRRVAALGALLAQAGLDEQTTEAALDQALAACEQAVTSARASLEALNQAKQRADLAERALAKAVTDWRDRATEREKRASVLDDRARQQAETQASLAEHQQSSRQQHALCRSSLASHGVVVTGDNAGDWRDLGDQHVAAHQARIDAASAADAQVQTLTAEVGGLQQLVQARQLSAQQAQAKQVAEQARLTATLAASAEARRCLDAQWTQILAADAHRPATLCPDLNTPPTVRLTAQVQWLDQARQVSQSAEDQFRQSERARTQATATANALGAQRSQVVTVRDQARADLDTRLATLSIDAEASLQALRLPADLYQTLRLARKSLEDRKLQSDALIDERAARLRSHEPQRPEELSSDADHEGLVQARDQAVQAHVLAQAAEQATGESLRAHYRAVTEQAGRVELLHKAQEEARVWATLNGYIGVNNGGHFKQFAQALNLAQLLEKANVHLARLAPRYRLLARLKDGLPTLEFDLSDLDQAGARVAPPSLSGGERFLVSLALALGLSDFRALKMPIETLLLDEGFGTLDPDTLAVALAALSQLQAEGRQVGIISHVVGLRERIEARIEVRRLGGGRSKLVTG